MKIESLILCALLGLMPLSVSAGDAASVDPEPSASEALEVRAVVEGQLEAFAAEQPARAFAFATPAIRNHFHDADEFVQMVRRSYPMLIRPASVSFFRAERSEDAILQAVHFRDHEGHLWRAVYELRRQPDRLWRINGCVVMPDNDSSTT